MQNRAKIEEITKVLIRLHGVAGLYASFFWLHAKKSGFLTMKPILHCIFLVLLPATLQVPSI